MSSRRYSSESSDTDSFKSFTNDEPPSQPNNNSSKKATRSTTSPTRKQSSTTDEHFPPEEEATSLAESNSVKGNANQLFASGSYENAIQTYDRALSSCPNYLDYEVAVLRSNIAACYLKLQEWKEAVESASKGVECLERLEPLPKVKGSKQDEAKGEDEVGQVEEVDEETEARIERLRSSGHTLDEVRKLQVKLLMRRAKGKTDQGGWASLQGAEEDYRVLLHPKLEASLSPIDKRQILEAVRKLQPRLNEAKEREMAEMMDKLKGLGNRILRPFGLSTNNFQFVKDEKTGGYSMNFQQNAKPPT